MDLKRIAAEWVLEQIPSDRLPEIACEALGSGLDCPSLRILAGEGNSNRSEVGLLWDRALSELGIPVPTWSEAWDYMDRVRTTESACDLLREILNGKVLPLQGAERVFWNIFHGRLDSEIDAEAPHILRDLVRVWCELSAGRDSERHNGITIDPMSDQRILALAQLYIETVEPNTTPN